jgi:hypothetical protein
MPECLAGDLKTFSQTHQSAPEWAEWYGVGRMPECLAGDCGKFKL